jgi:hypothetical protein
MVLLAGDEGGMSPELTTGAVPISLHDREKSYHEAKKAVSIKAFLDEEGNWVVRRHIQFLDYQNDVVSESTEEVTGKDRDDIIAIAEKL